MIFNILLAADGPSDFVIFFGRFHPLVVHMPIGFLILAFLMEMASRWQEKYKSLRDATGFALLLGGISAVVSAIVGFMLSQGGGYDDSTLFWHKWLGIFVAVFAFVAYFAKIKSENGDQQLMKQLYTFSLFAVMGIMTFAGHLGGNLTHGSTYLTQYTPEPFRSIVGMEPRKGKERKKITNLDSALVFEDIIQPMMEARCVSCHNPDKQKGELLLTSVEAFKAGGENGPIIEAGNAHGSEIYKRITLPHDDDDFMPPEGKTPLSDEEVEIIAWWINKGASYENKVAQVGMDDEIKLTLEKTLGVGEAGKPDFLETEMAAASPEAIEGIKKEGALVMNIAMENSFLDVNFATSGKEVTKANLEALLKAKDQVTWLNLSDCNITDEHLEIIGQLPNLTKLRLDKNEITDAGIKHLEKLEHLEYINLYGSKVGDESLNSLKKLPNLKKVYLWQTNVNKEAVSNVKEERPDMEINIGVEMEDSTANSTKEA
ncbi:c-type cytochrome domain-containing protein [Flexithrix dorotheae]|uniref:c-type cytochrome domain-containing protein n=1 Tax=Flexithrix dorotheae TaxID=70993 RepID=UPI000381FBC0|nr:c-type cytochrome domain-containing protein [Flexithrix dorotheae]